MLYLANVSYDADPGSLYLRLIAQQQSEQTWQAFEEPKSMTFDQASPPAIFGLALVKLSDGNQICDILDASDWLLEIVRKYLCSGVTADFLQQEAERAEQWRQTLTLQSQELGRRTLELEARMGQIQELEEKLKQGNEAECG
ncbi:MAG: hypothetical protein HC824_10130 [Synechococcales cyanobacterium RM1_1_8]|nr:hypothetical protein [Synechococcales cyanobacterium RM1_1_8]